MFHKIHPFEVYNLHFLVYLQSCLTITFILIILEHFHHPKRKPWAYLMWTLARSVHSSVDEMRQIHMDYWVLWRKREGMATLSRGEPPTLALTGFYWLSNSIHQRSFSFIILRFALGNYFLQIAMERMLLITSYRLTMKKCCKCKGTIRVIGPVTLQSLGELAQTSGSYFKDMQ